MRVVITGASGFVGGGLARHLCRHPDALGRPISGLIVADLARSADDRAVMGCDVAERRCGDLSDPVYLDHLFDAQVDILFHLASVPGSRAEQQPKLGWSVNLCAPLGLAQRLAQQGRQGSTAPRNVFASSIAVYGPLGPGPVTEDHPTRPTIN